MERSVLTDEALVRAGLFERSWGKEKDRWQALLSMMSEGRQ